jgi:hypothetical protein
LDQTFGGLVLVFAFCLDDDLAAGRDFEHASIREITRGANGVSMEMTMEELAP